MYQVAMQIRTQRAQVLQLWVINIRHVSNMVCIWEERSEARLLRKFISISIVQEFGERSVEFHVRTVGRQLAD